jgi:hypothetical protein
MIAEKLVNHPRAGLRPLADRDRGLGADDAGARLAIAETAHVGNRGPGGHHRIGRADLGLSALLRAATGQQRQHDGEPERNPEQKEHDANPVTRSVPFGAA